MMITIAELPAYIRKVEKKLSEDEQDDLKNFLAINPLAGDVIEGTGGLRKLRWSVGNKGKSGGVRVIYYFYNEILPLYLITAFMKNEKINLTKAERNELAKLVEILKKSAR
ncbi:addiction module toxin RelE [Allofrancisella guangzhouensis]|nr:addiction module toxin RelE [Allofrancisella guangzhouensis]